MDLSPAHAAANHVAGVFSGDLFKHCRAYADHFAGRDVVGAFGTLAMGKNYAVELAQHAHITLLRRAGGYRRGNRVLYRSTLPRGPFYEALNIDDHIGLVLVPAAELGRLNHSLEGASALRRRARHDLTYFERIGRV